MTTHSKRTPASRPADLGSSFVLSGKTQDIWTRKNRQTKPPARLNISFNPNQTAFPRHEPITKKFLDQRVPAVRSRPACKFAASAAGETRRLLKLAQRSRNNPVSQTFTVAAEGSAGMCCTQVGAWTETQPRSVSCVRPAERRKGSVLEEPKGKCDSHAAVHNGY